MTGRLVAVLCLTGAVLAVPAAAQTVSPNPIAGVGVDERLDAPAVFGPALATAGVRASDIGTFVRLLVPWATLDAARTSARWATLDARLDGLREAAAPVLLVIENAPVSLDQSAGWPDAIRAVAVHTRGRVVGLRNRCPSCVIASRRAHVRVLSQAGRGPDSVGRSAVGDRADRDRTSGSRLGGRAVRQRRGRGAGPRAGRTRRGRPEAARAPARSDRRRAHGRPGPRCDVEHGGQGVADRGGESSGRHAGHGRDVHRTGNEHCRRADGRARSQGSARGTASRARSCIGVARDRASRRRRLTSSAPPAALQPEKRIDVPRLLGRRAERRRTDGHIARSFGPPANDPRSVAAANHARDRLLGRGGDSPVALRCAGRRRAHHRGFQLWGREHLRQQRRRLDDGAAERRRDHFSQSGGGSGAVRAVRDVQRDAEDPISLPARRRHSSSTSCPTTGCMPRATTSSGKSCRSR